MLHKIIRWLLLVHKDKNPNSERVLKGVLCAQIPPSSVPLLSNLPLCLLHVLSVQLNCFNLLKHSKIRAFKYLWAFKHGTLSA